MLERLLDVAITLLYSTAAVLFLAAAVLYPDGEVVLAAAGCMSALLVAIRVAGIGGG